MRILRAAEQVGILSPFKEAPGHLDKGQQDELMGMINDPVTGGGFTMRDHPGDAPNTGTYVSRPRSEGHEEQKLKRPEVSGENQADYLNRKWDVIHSRPDQFGGGYDYKGDWYNDVTRNFDDPWEAAMDATGGNQISVYNHENMYGQGPTDVMTPRFLNDQIAKGGRRDES